MDQVMPDELPEDLKELLEIGSEFIQHYTICAFMIDGKYAHHENARDAYQGFTWPTQEKFDELIEAMYSITGCDAVYGSPLDSRILYEIGRVRERTVGKYKPDVHFLVSPFGGGRDAYDSAFEFVDALLHATTLVLRSCDLRAIFGVRAFDDLELAHEERETNPDDVEEEEETEAKDLDAHAHEAVVYFAGLANTLPAFDSHKLLAELNREVYAVLEFRRTNESWRSKGSPASDSVWSEPRSPGEWAKAFNVHRDTFLARVKDGKIRAKKLTSKSYRVHKDDLPNRRFSTP